MDKQKTLFINGIYLNSKTYFECFNALLSIAKELKMEAENNGTNTNK